MAVKIGGQQIKDVESKAFPIRDMSDDGDGSDVLQRDTEGKVILGPDGKPKVCTITLLGPSSEKRRAVEASQDNERRKRVERSGKLMITSAEADHQLKLEKLCQCTVAWEGISDENGPLPCTYGNARDLYTSNTWLMRQKLAELETAGFAERAGTHS